MHAPETTPHLPAASAPDVVFDKDAPVQSGHADQRVFALGGRIGRLRYLAYAVVLGLVIGIAVAVAGAIATGVLGRAPGTMLSLLLSIPLGAVAVVVARRRLQDLDRNGWFSLLTLIPLANFFFSLYLAFAPGTAGPNRHGAAPPGNPVWVVVLGLLMPVLVALGMLIAVVVPAYDSYVGATRSSASGSTF